MASTVAYGDENAGFQARDIYGPVNTTFHLPPGELRNRPSSRGPEPALTDPALERRETPPPPSIVIPFERDNSFVERGTILGDIERRCAGPDSWTALVGLGGVG
jgi:hypothetical protein